ncbi:MAG TPA: hypothetical protein VEL74_23280 [Thermoanaerobaculia bacterium]|nr:hypothetical protein [Thermoanaerobaculia bacterium]
MKKTAGLLAAALLPLLAFFPAAAQRPAALPYADAIRLAEAFRLAETVQERVFPGWSRAPFSVLLASGERDLLVRHPEPSAEFSELGYSSILRERVFTRPGRTAPDLLATFPVIGASPTVVVGSAERTGLRSTEWVLTVLHEHFHQFQMADPGYFAAVERLGLAGVDRTGMWMLNYPFPYDAPATAARFADLSRRLAALLRQGADAAPATVEAFWRDYRAFLAGLGEKDRLYFSFQIWQEGVPRYIELRSAQVAAEAYEPSLEFRALPDARGFDEVAGGLRTDILAQLDSANLGRDRRVAFYAFGAGLCLLLDRSNPDWKSRYMAERFSLERSAGVPSGRRESRR